MLRNLFLLFIFLFTSAIAQNYVSPLRSTTAWAPFYHGVASGDPTQDAVILWTRITPDNMNTNTISGTWEIATDTLFQNVVNSGTFTTDSLRDYTVHVDAANLSPDTWYYYRFKVNGVSSPIGRTRTLPTGNVNQFRIAVFSCSNYQHGYFHAYENLCKRNDVDLVVHLGDYIYEYAAGVDFSTGIVREHYPKHEIITLEDYRLRYSQYRLDHKLRWLHQNYPFIVIWDDHELANDAWKSGAQNHDPATEGPFAARKANMLQANREWMPMRITDPNDSLREWRSFNGGSLFDLFMLDTRHYDRDKQPSGPTDDATINDPSRYLIGQAQMQWLTNGLQNSTAKWKIIGNQVMFAPIKVSIPFVFDGPINVDQWDGYEAERQRLVNTLLNINNFAFITGDIHSTWANDLPLDPNTTYDENTGAGSIGVEFVTTSVTSQGLPFNLDPNLSLSIVKTANKHVKFLNGTERGYLILDITQSKIQGDWFFEADVKDSTNTSESFGTAWFVNDGEKFLRQANNPVNVPAGYNPPLVYEQLPSNISLLENTIRLIEIYPNPVAGTYLNLQYFLEKPAEMEFVIYNSEGKKIQTLQTEKKSQGLHYMALNVSQLGKGLYLLELKDKKTGEKTTYKFIKE